MNDMCRWRGKNLSNSKGLPESNQYSGTKQIQTQQSHSVEPIDLKKIEDPAKRKISDPQGDEKLSADVKVAEEQQVGNDTEKKSAKKNSEKMSELNTLQGVPTKMPTMDVFHDPAKKDKYYRSEELL
ncbi:unnamed protein product [Anisakis simplex]|uniref:Ovule protein n=1 Tax=Anisakis simplex TaxID=6269 RepID=A0A0M3J2I3_ANISI|nr:unnamed protein product [Anisakis simplex]